jgi:hypothetical protein
VKYADRAALVLEKRREDDLREAGFGFIRWTYGELLNAEIELVARLLRRVTDG